MSTTMGSGGPDLQSFYESLRAQATGQEPSAQVPQGMALLLRAGLPAWMVAWAQVTSQAPARPITRREPDVPVTPGGGGDEVVSVLAAMVRASCHGSVS